ncbi:MAG: MlaD family protein [Planctomycetota bacterium]
MKTIRYVTGAVTLAAGILGAILLWSLLGGGGEEDGFTITLLFESADGLSRGSAVKTHGVKVGEVRRIALSASGAAAEIVCSVEPEMRATLRATTRFWIVRPLFRGISEGASGLDTLIKDSYIACNTPRGIAPPLPGGSRVPGLDRPPGGDGDALDLRARPGDLHFTVLFRESHGLKRGDPVRTRGLPIGVVLSVDLAPAARGVLARARIAREHRELVTHRSLFWVARAELEAGWLSGVAVREMEALLGGASLSLYTPPGESDPPAPDDAHFAGREERPDFEWPAPFPVEGASPGSNASPPDRLHRSLVRVHYSFVEKDWLSKDDVAASLTPGILFRTTDGVAAVLVPRSGVDGGWTTTDGLGDPEISRERLQVQLADGSVLRAGRVWVDPDGADLALLRVEEGTHASPETRIRFTTAGGEAGPGGAVEIITLKETGGFHRFPASLGEDGTLTGIPPGNERGLVFQGGLAIGAFSIGPDADEEDAAPRVALFSRVPEPLRAHAP